MGSCLEFLRGNLPTASVAAQDRPLLVSNAASGASLNPGRARENLILVLFNHNDFVTIR